MEDAEAALTCGANATKVQWSIVRRSYVISFCGCAYGCNGWYWTQTTPHSASGCDLLTTAAALLLCFTCSLSTTPTDALQHAFCTYNAFHSTPPKPLHPVQSLTQTQQYRHAVLRASTAHTLTHTVRQCTLGVEMQTTSLQQRIRSLQDSTVTACTSFGVSLQAPISTSTHDATSQCPAACKRAAPSLVLQTTGAHSVKRLHAAPYPPSGPLLDRHTATKIDAILRPTCGCISNTAAT